MDLLRENSSFTYAALNLIPALARLNTTVPNANNKRNPRICNVASKLPGWVAMGLTTSQLDFVATPYTPQPVADNAGLLAFFEQNQDLGLAELEKATEEQLLEPWTLRNG
jgi:hypothetical protein